MKFFLALTAVFLPIIVNAQSSGTATTGAAASSPTAIQVIVSPQNALAFSQSSIVAPNGTRIDFVWQKTAIPHTVSQSSPDSVCAIVEGGFSSGPITDGQFSLTVENDQNPVVFFCGVMVHCSRGMLGVINPAASGPGSEADVLASALALGANQAPVTQTAAITGGVSGVVASSTPTQVAASSASSSASTSTSTSKSSDAGRLVASGVFALLATALGIMLA